VTDVTDICPGFTPIGHRVIAALTTVRQGDLLLDAAITTFLFAQDRRLPTGVRGLEALQRILRSQRKKW